MENIYTCGGFSLSECMGAGASGAWSDMPNEAQIDHIALVLYDKLSQNPTISNVLAPINIWRDVAFFKEPFIIGGIETSQKNIKKVLTVYFMLLDQGAVKEFSIYDKTLAIFNDETSTAIARFMMNNDDYQIYAKEQPSNVRTFVHNILINYCGWNKDNYDPAKWGEEKADQRADLWSSIVGQYKQIGATVTAAAGTAYLADKILPIAAAAALGYIFTRKN